MPLPGPGYSVLSISSQTIGRSEIDDMVYRMAKSSTILISLRMKGGRRGNIGRLRPGGLCVEG